MATSNVNDEHEQWESASRIVHQPHEWSDSSDDDNDDVDNQEFFDADDTDFNQNQSPSTKANAEANLLHERLNAQLSTNEKDKKTLPGKIISTF